jgi:hypothetical protein
MALILPVSPVRNFVTSQRLHVCRMFRTPNVLIPPPLTTLLISHPPLRNLPDERQPESPQPFLCIPPSSESGVHRHEDRGDNEDDAEKFRELNEQVDDE